MKKILLLAFLLNSKIIFAQTIPNGDFKKWDAETNCPVSWNCNNDTDCKGKIILADKIKGGAKLMVQHCWDPKKEDRSNNVNMSYDELSAKIAKGKKVKVSFTYSYAPIGSDQAYIKIDTDFDEEVNNTFPMFFYNDNKEGFLKAGKNIAVNCYLNFEPAEGKNYTAPQNCVANSIRTSFGIMAADATGDVHKGTTLIIHNIKFSME
jgi:hypothetical protein